MDQQTIMDTAFKVKVAQEIGLTIPPLVEAYPIPQDIPLDVLYEDDDVIGGGIIHSSFML